MPAQSSDHIFDQQWKNWYIGKQTNNSYVTAGKQCKHKVAGAVFISKYYLKGYHGQV